MKIFALIPNEYLREAEVSVFQFETNCTLSKNDRGELTLVLTVKDENGKPKNGTQFIAEFKNNDA